MFSEKRPVCVCPQRLLPKTLALIRFDGHLNDKNVMVYTTPWNWLYDKIFVNIRRSPPRLALLCPLRHPVHGTICYWMDKEKFICNRFRPVLRMTKIIKKLGLNEWV